MPQPAALMEAALGQQSVSPVGLVRVAVTLAASRFLAQRLPTLLADHAGLKVKTRKSTAVPCLVPLRVPAIKKSAYCCNNLICPAESLIAAFSKLCGRVSLPKSLWSLTFPNSEFSQVCDTFAHLRDPPTVERQRDFTNRCRSFVFRAPDGDRSELEVIAG